MFATIDDLEKLNLRIGEIKTVESVEGSEKLLKLQVDLGDEERQILSGIAKWYTADDLVGQKVIIVANLAPRSMMGLESQGMILCANSEAGPALLSPTRSVVPGASIQ